jgi:hypothetical protein
MAFGGLVNQSSFSVAAICGTLLHQCIEKISINLKKNEAICTSTMMILKNGWNGYPKN